MPDIYHLYLDESDTHDQTTTGVWTNKHFCIAGIVVKKDFHDTFVTTEVNRIKNQLWGRTDYILHEMDIRFANNSRNSRKLSSIDPQYRIFQNSRPNNILYSGLAAIVNRPEITVLGGCVIEDELHRHYDRTFLPDKSLIIMQVLIENFCHFLKRNNGIGYVYYESVGDKQDNIVRRRFNQVEVMGTMYVSPQTVQNLIVNIHFPLKTDNVAGLQLADFIPNSIVRKAAGKAQHQYNIETPIRISRYHGGMNKHDKFGVKIIPKT